jgi:TetR/AcrR family transcriptional regulator
MTFEVPAHGGKPASRIRQKNEETILKAAEDEFARHGYKGTSMNTIAQNAGLPKANLHYYFTNKLGLYVAVLSNIIELWDSTFNTLTAEDDPAEALTRYIRAKMEFSRRQPQASRIFAMEVISGGECLTEYFNQDYRAWFQGRAAVFQAWIDAGKMDPVDPVHLIFLLWGSTQHYADFATQICRQRAQQVDQAGHGRRRQQPDPHHSQRLRPHSDYLRRLCLSPSAVFASTAKRFAKAASSPSPRRSPAPLSAGVHRTTQRPECHAQLLGVETRAQYRSNDDGEPGGTAGRPILAAIEAQDCDQVVVLVIRWYGGIQLGTGGLARAYGGGANKCLQAAKIELISRVPLSCACGFAELALVKLRRTGGLVVEENFTANGVNCSWRWVRRRSICCKRSWPI